jgi:dTDP-4-amino-4,6-dideoxygalactose transaminase
MQFVDLKAQQERIREGIDANISAVLDHGKYIMGPEVGQLEEELKAFVGIKHAIACASGTDALLLALLAEDIGPGDAIFTSPFTFIATAEVISLLGATPVFVDIDPKTFNIDPEKLDQAITAFKNNDPSLHPLPITHDPSSATPRAVIGVDLFGLPADYDRVNAIAKEHLLFVIEDAAQSFGAEYNGKKACSLADMACTSFFPAKPLGCYGDGGMCFTDDDRIAEFITSLRVHGKGHHKYDNIHIGINGRLDTIQAAILLAKFDLFSEEIEFRQKVARRYTSLLASHFSVLTPEIPSGYKSVWAQYSILAKDEEHRSELQNKLKEDGIPTAIYYPKPLHLQTAFASLGYHEGDFPISEDVSCRIFSLPMHPYLTEAEQEKITSVLLHNYFRGRGVFFVMPAKAGIQVDGLSFSGFLLSQE